MASEKPEAKIVLLGQEKVGKTSLTVRILHDRFDDAKHQPTLGAAYGRKLIGDVMMAIWDTAGSERFRAMTRQFYRNAFAAVVCFDLTESCSWEIVKSWVDELRHHEPDCRVYFCGTKLDLIQANPKSRQVNLKSVQDFTRSLQNGYLGIRGTEYGIYEASSKTGEGVDELFTQIGEDFLDKKCYNFVPVNKEEIKQLTMNEKKFKKGCRCRSAV